MKPGDQTANAKSMASVFRDEGHFTNEGIAALLGGGIQESSLNPQSGRGSAHQGIFQWSDERRAAIEAHFGKSLMNMSPAEQARATIWELHAKPEFKGILGDYQTSHDLPDLNNKTTRQFENPGNFGTEVPNRLRLSQGVLAGLGPSGDAASLPSATTPSGAPGGAGASGKVDVNVRVDGGGQVTARGEGDIGLNVRRPQIDGLPFLPSLPALQY